MWSERDFLSLDEDTIEPVIAEYLDLGRDAFLRRYSGLAYPARTHFLFAAGELLDAKAVAFVAFERRFGPAVREVPPSERPHTSLVARLLRRLDITVVQYDAGRLVLEVIPTVLDTYDVSDEKEPFSQPDGRRVPPAVSKLGKDHPNFQPRQQWFERQITRLAEARQSRFVPWQFKTSDGKARRLDQGCVGFAMANGFLVMPENREELLHFVELSARALGEAQSSLSDDPDDAGIVRTVTATTSRPGQRSFSVNVRRAYAHQCAVTGCRTPQVLEAAHIGVKSGIDDNRMTNGILLRKDIHGLLDALLITFAPDGRSIVVSDDLDDQGYEFLNGAAVTEPVRGPRPGAENIQQHRDRFRLRQHRRP
ncbi:HNH endonuclease (plasmid) [Azospirillum oryzae]|uniref:HNH endonuclease n=1 Tax=Azospirillum oryzae TaxID=286727 RepID=A0A6N1AFC7_9PROT|nr:HNH endonuclease signature motif containing protein [Azospirillum oryzae]KAA0584519.1 HNH endonuclease [Azospirillum oryzae]QKS49798.1 HNH endonuclease [Azospirillum oryzae]GLR79059.1 hypothetical protein GCM10007856_17330 [Azospirillum oryzae]